jgi:hypothetical protein
LQTLQNLGNLNIESNKRYSIVTINRYSIYNDVENQEQQQEQQQSNNRVTTEQQQSNTYKKTKNYKNDKKKEKANAFDALEEQLPEALRTEQFKAAWSSYLAHRKEQKKPLTATAANAAIKKLEGWGHDRAVAALMTTVEHGWTGIFESKDGTGRTTRTMPTGPGQVFISEGDKF